MYISGSNGTRISETLKPIPKSDPNYGIRLMDIHFGFKNSEGRIVFDNSHNRKVEDLHCAKITIQNSKTNYPNCSDEIWLGKSNYAICTLSILFRTYHKLYDMSRKHPYWFSARPEAHLFQWPGKFITTQKMRKILKQLVEEIGFYESDKITPHSFRRCFNTQHCLVGTPPAFIASLGRWSLVCAFYRYAKPQKIDMIKMQERFWTGVPTSGVVVDFDKETEVLLFQKMRNDYNPALPNIM